ncbi:S-layer homology domain protein [anaerobic digester metagenome]
MKIFKRIIAVIITTSLLLSQGVLAAESSDNKVAFSDIDENYWAYESVEKLVEAGIISGYPDGTFIPEGYITRAELVKVVNLIYSFSEKVESTDLTDIKSDDWFYENVLIAQASGYINGYPDGTFKPNDFVTRQELCKIIDTINKLVNLPYDKAIADEVSPWAVDYVNKVVSNRIMLLDDNNNFRASEKATRAEACDALAKFVSDDVIVPEPSQGGGGGITEEELDSTMDDVIRRLEMGVIPELSTDAQKEIVNDIITNMENYQSDSSYDYESAAQDAYEKYKSLDDSEKSELKSLIIKKNSPADMIELQKFFFPDKDIQL